MSYFDPETPGSFAGARLNKSLKKWLKQQNTYTLHAPARKKFPRRKTIVPGPHFQVQADLIDFSALKKYNSGYKYILVLIDVFSKMAAVAFLKKKTGPEMVKAFSQAVSEIGPFQKLQTDLGREFFNKTFQDWLQQQNMTHFHTFNFEIKASIAERFIRTIKERLWRFFTHTNTRRYIEVLPKLVKSYNRTYHSSIKRSPISVNEQNQEQVWQTLYSENKKVKKPKLKVNDQVRLSVTRQQFRKGYLPRWTEEIFEIAQVFQEDPPYYKIKDWNGDVLDGTFYEEELQKVYKNNELYSIERIIKKRRTKKGVEYLIKWSGYPDSFNSWVTEKNLCQI